MTSTSTDTPLPPPPRRVNARLDGVAPLMVKNVVSHEGLVEFQIRVDEQSRPHVEGLLRGARAGAASRKSPLVVFLAIQLVQAHDEDPAQLIIRVDPHVNVGDVPGGERRFDLFVAYSSSNGEEQWVPLGGNGETCVPTVDALGPWVPRTQDGFHFCPYVARHGRISVRLAAVSALLREASQPRTLISACEIEDGVLRFSGWLLLTAPRDWIIEASCILKKRHTQNVCEVAANVRARAGAISARERRELEFDVRVPLRELSKEGSLDEGHWTVVLKVSLPGGRLDVSVGSRSGIGTMYRFGGLGTVRDESKNLIFLPEFSTVGKLLLHVRALSQFDDELYERRQAAALELDASLEATVDGDAWLVTEKLANSAQDNGFHFFRYCYENHPEKPVYFLLREDSPDRHRVQQFSDRVVDFYSERHFFLLKRASLLIGSDSRIHFLQLDPIPSAFTRILAQKKVLFLQHGVLALKNVSGIYRSTGPNRVDRFIVSSNWEREIVVKHMRYPRAVVSVTGLARWDRLRDRSSGRGDILVMPTWRNWLQNVPVDQFRQSDFFLKYRALLTSTELRELLRETGGKLIVYLHPMFARFVEHMDLDDHDVQLVRPGQIPLNHLLMQADLLVTDYSSVIWDFAKMDKPIIFYHFDADDYLARQGAYVNFDKDLIGPAVGDANALIGEIKKSRAAGYGVLPEFVQKYEDAFAFHDRNNCERIFAEAQHCESDGAKSKVLIYLKAARRMVRGRISQMKRGELDLSFHLRGYVHQLLKRRRLGRKLSKLVG